MAKYYKIECDICGRDIDAHRDAFKCKTMKIKRLKHSEINWKKLDVCDDCMIDFEKYVGYKILGYELDWKTLRKSPERT